MLVMYFVIASAWCIMEATMHTEYFSGQRLSTDPFLTLKFILFYIVYGSQFQCKKLNQFCLLTFPTKYPQKLLCHNFPNLILMLPILCHSLFCFCFYFPQEERLLRMGNELSRLTSYEAECHRKDGVIAALRDEVVDLKGALESSCSFRYICSCQCPLQTVVSSLFPGSKMVGSVRKCECENKTGGNLLFPDYALIFSRAFHLRVIPAV